MPCESLMKTIEGFALLIAGAGQVWLSAVDN